MPESLSNPRLGRFVETPITGKTVRAFMSSPLPLEPTIDVQALVEQLSLAECALERLDGITLLLRR